MFGCCEGTAVRAGEIVMGVEGVLMDCELGVVVVCGGASSVPAGALAVAKVGFMVALVEAGLRVRNRSMQKLS